MEKQLDKDGLRAEICDVLADFLLRPDSQVGVSADRIIKKVDEYVEGRVIEARLEVMKNFGAV